MHRHIVVVSFLEWLSWNNRGALRVSAQRVIWCADDCAASAFLNSLQFAPDLEPADDAFLVAEINRPPRNFGNGMLFLSLDGTSFEALSERSSRLLSPAAKRMNADLELATEGIREVWADWKARYKSESADQQARRIWSWAWAQPWPSELQSQQEQLLVKTRQSLGEMSRLLAENSALHEKIAGTSAETWIHMALAAEQGKLLAPDKDAAWREASRPYIQSCASSGQLTAAFFPKADAAFSNALAKLPLDRIEMLELVAVATGEHHALRMNVGHEPDFETLFSDLQILSDLAFQADPNGRSIILSAALLALGQLLPGTAVVALQAQADFPVGWAGGLLGGNEKMELSDRAVLTEAPQLPSAAVPKSITENEFGSDGSASSDADPDIVTVVAGLEGKTQPVTVAYEASNVPTAASSIVTHVETKPTDNDLGVPKEERLIKRRSGNKKAVAKVPSKNSNEQLADQKIDLFSEKDMPD